MLPRLSSYLLAERSVLTAWLGSVVNDIPMRHEHQMFFGFGVWLLGIIGLVWFLNAADAIFFMPRHSTVQRSSGNGSNLDPDLVLEPYHGRLALNLRVSFRP